MERKIRIALAEDGAVNRQSFLRKLPAMPQCELVFVATNGHDCLEQLKGLPQSLRPDVLFMDIEMPRMNGIETIARARPLYPSVHFLVLTVFDDDDKVFAAIRAGAEGYLLKHESAEALQEAALNVMEFGGAPMSPAIARKALALLRQSTPAATIPAPEVPQEISARELEVLQLMVSGQDAKSIASSLHISVFTVRKHIANVYEKLHVNSKAQIMALAHQSCWF
ncbi:MAG: response regulator transcription factor [Bacteroidetes bacterium]|nr:response regulator transcription factor [Bacteroidota bacterium]